MKIPESERSTTASSEQMTLTPDHRIFYALGTQAPKSWTGVGFKVLLGAAVLVLLWFIISGRPKPLMSPRPSEQPSVPIRAANPSPVLIPPWAVIAEPSPEWMTAFNAVMQSASKSDTASVLLLMSQLVRLQPSRAVITAQQRTAARAHNAKGLAAIKASDFKIAADELVVAFQIDASDAEVAENLGYALFKGGKTEFATRALLQSLVASPRRATAWGNLGNAYVQGNEPVQAAAAFSLSLRYAKSPSRGRSQLVTIYQEDVSPVLRAAVGSALASQYTELVDPALRGQLSALSSFPFSALLPSKIPKIGDASEKIVQLHALNNADFPLKVNAAEYTIWLGSTKDCRVQACVVGVIAGLKSQLQAEDEGVVVELVGGARGMLSRASENKLGVLVTQRDGIVYRFAFGNDTDLLSMANSALSLGFIPASVFNYKDISRSSHENAAPPEIAPQASVVHPASTLIGLLSISPKGPPLSSEQIYKRAANSVVVVTVLNGQGSGVVVAPEIVLTNCHVTKQGAVAVHYRKTKYKALVLAGNEEMDYCILQVAGLPATPAPMGPLGDVAPGQRVYSLGSPRGFELTFAEGIVSALRPTVGMPLPIIQTTAPISPGSSGGGLFDEYGRVIGITTFFRVEAQNLNFAMPVELYRHLIRAPALPPATPEASSIPLYPPNVRPVPAPSSQPWPASACNIEYDIELQTFGEHVSVELRSGAPGASRVVKTQTSQGGRVSFSSLCPGSYFVAIGNDDYVSVTPVRQFSSDREYTSQLTLQRGSGNVSKQSRKTL